MTHPRPRILSGAVLASAALGLTSCGLVEDDSTISIVVTESAPFQEPAEIAAELLEEQGYELDITYMTDIVQPNQVVNQGEYEGNYFQHLAYLNNFNASNDTAVQPLFSVYYAPAGLFSLEYDSLEELPDGAEINLPVDPSNNGRALQLLADEGLIEVDESVSIIDLTQNDITENPRDFRFVETDQQSAAQVLPDVDAGFAFVRLIAEADLDVEETALSIEDGREEVRTPFTCVVAVGPEGVSDEQAQALQDAFQSEEVEQWFEDYQGGVIDFEDFITIDNAEEIWTDFSA
ncbi:MetQ/NlpA family ABC transporter substrate-binding protein [Nesterenkonia sandarakina]|uniref:D-methionine transport system substrate-binding protein n=1 Tax=Nesterenkonia sandarakina TaxID=272918 RepID=A0A7Z0E970_9MICC|nr:MetQ/NlpA family ABC transporter substrate-binding protein [Nesterenkonia sandarakina]NYJ16652.1 D-methionine transport system substrate-binding protein [Nesterenkonia sandarakina]